MPPTMSSPSREGPPTLSSPSDQVIDVSSDSPALFRSSFSDSSRRDSAADTSDAADHDDDDDEVDDDAVTTGVSELEFSEHQYRRGRHAIPMQSPGDESLHDLSGRRRAQLPKLRKRHFFDDAEVSGREFSRAQRPRGRILQKIIFRRRKRGEDDAFWTGIFLSNVFSLFLMIFIVVYLMQTDFFESHQNDLFGTTVDDRFTVVSPESSDAKITLKSGYSTSRYSEAMIAFGNGELRVGRRALGPTDTQSFYGLSLANNGSASFTNKLHAPFVKTDYLHAAKALVFDDGTVMTTAANLTGGINEVGDLNLVSKTGSVTLTSGGKPVVKIDKDATVNFLDADSDDPQVSGIVLQAATGDVSIGGSFRIHHDDDDSVISSSHPIKLNTTQVVLGSVNSTRTVLTCPDPTHGNASVHPWAYKEMTFAIVGQSSSNQSRGGNVEILGGDGSTSGGDVILSGGITSGKSAKDEGPSRGSVLINAKLDRTTRSTTEIGSHSTYHKVLLHGAVSVNDGSDSGHPTTFHVGGGAMSVDSKTISLNNTASNGSQVIVSSKAITLEASSTASVSIGPIMTIVSGSEILALQVPVKANSTHEASITLDGSGGIQLSASRSLTFDVAAPNASAAFHGPVEFGIRAVNDSAYAPDLFIGDHAVTVDAAKLTVGDAGLTTDVSIQSSRVRVGDTELESNVTIIGANAHVNSKNIHLGKTASQVTITGHDVHLKAGRELKLTGGNKSTFSVDSTSITLSGDKIHIGDQDSDEISIGDSSTGISVTPSAIVIGASIKSLAVGGKTSAVKIGGSDATVDISGKVTLNGKKLEISRRLEDLPTGTFGYAGAREVVVDLPTKADAAVVPIQLKYSLHDDFIDVAADELRFKDSVDFGSTSHLRFGLSLTNVRAQVEDVKQVVSTPRQPKLKCQILRVGDQPSVLLELVVPLEFCSGDSDCKDDIFFGGSTQIIAEARATDRYHVQCTSTTLQRLPNSKLLVGHVQLEVSSVL